MLPVWAYPAFLAELAKLASRVIVLSAAFAGLKVHYPPAPAV